MKCYRPHGLPLMIALAGLGMGTAVTFAQNTESAPSSTPDSSTSSSHHNSDAHHGMKHEGGEGPGGPLVGTTLKATKQLNLTAAQKTQVKTILHNAREQRKSEAGAMDMTVLGDPSNPGYSAALQTMKTHAADRVQQASEIQSQIYNVLTPEQKSKLPSVLASLKSKHAGRTASTEEKKSAR
jgi:Spy/CpxP family protein refolding chaperone